MYPYRETVIKNCGVHSWKKAVWPIFTIEKRSGSKQLFEESWSMLRRSFCHCLHGKCVHWNNDIPIQIPVHRMDIGVHNLGTTCGFLRPWVVVDVQGNLV
jgi:hypothetical protein